MIVGDADDFQVRLRRLSLAVACGNRFFGGIVL